jgi:hypothetical protein
MGHRMHDDVHHEKQEHPGATPHSLPHIRRIIAVQAQACKDRHAPGNGHNSYGSVIARDAKGPAVGNRESGKGAARTTGARAIGVSCNCAAVWNWQECSDTVTSWSR